MDFALTEEQREIQALAREVADTEIGPNASEWDREHRFPGEVFSKLGGLGLMGEASREALPALREVAEKAKKDENRPVQRAAGDAMRQISGRGKK